jgi:hypothetical protein
MTHLCIIVFLEEIFTAQHDPQPLRDDEPRAMTQWKIGVLGTVIGGVL